MHVMNKHPPPELEMTIDGEFVSPPTPPIGARVLVGALVVAVIAGALSIAALALWLAMMILPVALAAGVIAWGMYRYRLWRDRLSLGGRQDLWRP